MKEGRFVISLDFELFWGVRDKRTIEEYGQNILGARKIIPELLGVFHRYNIRATFATVGFLFFDSKEQLLEALPGKKPGYLNKDLSPYTGAITAIGSDEKNDPYHFAHSIITNIQQYPAQEIGCHTFSHYYCLEPGQSEDEFEADLQAANNIANKHNIKLKSLVFPRNQYNSQYLEICRQSGITSYRGNERSWLYNAKNGEEETTLRRGFRLIDAYINISGHNCHHPQEIAASKPYNIASSRFLRPYSRKLAIFDWLRLKRIKSGMLHAAQNGLVYHLWWHPHNFGADREQNLSFLIKILEYYKILRLKYGFDSVSMQQLSEILDQSYNEQ